jgi:hypothetical protein
VKFAPAPPPPVSLEDEATLENGGDLSVRLGQPVNVQVVPTPGPYPRATIAAAPKPVNREINCFVTN